MQGTKEFADFLSEGWCLALRERFNIRHVEQFGGLLASPDGETALRRIGVPIDRVWDPTETVLKAAFGASLRSFGRPGQSKEERAIIGAAPDDLRLSFGLDQQRDPFSKSTFGSPIPEIEKKNGPERSARNGYFSVLGSDQANRDEKAPPESFVVDVPPQLPSARDQEQRGTCVAFTVCSMWELMHRRLNPEADDLVLSPQFIFHWAKKTDERERQDGTTFSMALRQMVERGVCTERLCSYHGFHDFGQSYVFEKDHLLDAGPVESDAKLRKITGSTRLASGNVDAIKRVLTTGRPVGLGVPVYRNAWLGGYCQLRGEVTLPLIEQAPDGTDLVLDTHMGSHAVCVVGYRDNDPNKPESDRPGGGYFIFRNSWGKVWSQAPLERHLLPGYGVLPYAYVGRFWLDAYAIESLQIGEEAVKAVKASTTPKRKDSVSETATHVQKRKRKVAEKKRP